MPAWIVMLLARHWKTGLAVAVVLALVGGAAGYVWGLQRTISRQAQELTALRTELAQARDAMRQLTQAVRDLRPGETRTITVDRPVPIRVPGPTQIVERQVPVVVTRTEHTVETRVQTIELPAREIERIIRESPQSIRIALKATRAIAEGEEFGVVVSQVQPGIWQGLLEVGAPIAATVTTITPVERIPAPLPAVRRLTFSLYGGYSFRDQWLTGLRATYRVSDRLTVEGSGEHRWATSTQDYRLLAVWSF